MTDRAGRASRTAVLMIVALLAGALQAQDPPQPQTQPAEESPWMADGPEEYSGFTEAKNRVYEYTGWLKLSADFRARWVLHGNPLLQKGNDSTQGTKVENEQSYGMFRTRFGWSILPVDHLEFNFRLVTENRLVCRPEGGLNKRYERGWQCDEVLFDRFNVALTGLFDTKSSVTVGRQDISLDDGWLVGDGTPLDGTRTFFFDAARATVDMPQYQSTLDVIGIDQKADLDSFIKPWNDQDGPITEQDEVGAIVHLTGKSIDRTEWSGYFIYKHDDKEDHLGNNADIYTAGGRLAGDLAESLAYRVEVAPQVGQKNRQDIVALGANSRVTWKTGDAIDSKLFADYEYRSGGKTPDRGFDVLWGRQYQWSYIYNGVVDSLEDDPFRGPNLHRFGPGWQFSLVEDFEITAKYNALYADRNNQWQAQRLTGANDFSHHGKFRGHLVTTNFDYRTNRHLSQQVIAEVFVPGNYYTENRNDTALFLRYQILLEW